MRRFKSLVPVRHSDGVICRTTAYVFLNAGFYPALFLCLLLDLPATAKVNLSGGIWVTYWAQQQSGDQSYEVATAMGWQPANAQVTGAPWRGAAPSGAAKTFILANGLYGNGQQAHTASGYGFRLNLDCPLTDDLKVNGCFRVRTGTNGVTARQLSAAYILHPQATLRVGLFSRPFGYEGAGRPGTTKSEVFISEYAQDARALLNNKTDVGVMLSGTLQDKRFEYSLYAGNGCARTVADSPALSTTGLANAASATPDADDAKQLNANLRWNVMTVAFVGGGYVAGDMANRNTLAGATVGRSRFTAADAYGVWDIAQQLLVSGEYATVRHDQMALESDAGVVGNPARTQLTATRVNEYILKAVYHGIPDWECGVRYTVVDPTNFEAELLAGYSRERKLSVAIGYQFAGSAQLRAEYSRLITDYDYLNAYDPVLLAGQYRLNPNEDPDDDIVAVSLGLQF